MKGEYNMNKEYLPLGSVVLLKDSSKRVMVMGFLQAQPGNEDEVYDYCGCLYPEGFMDADSIYLFNNDMIDKVYSIGYMDEEQFTFENKLIEIASKIRGGNEA